jgi:hypothetical protein
MVAALPEAAGLRPGRLAECRDVEVTGTAQHEAWQSRALPPVQGVPEGDWCTLAVP